MGANTVHHVCWRDPGGQGPGVSLANGAGPGKTGNILIETVGAAATATYATTLLLRKTTL